MAGCTAFPQVTGTMCARAESAPRLPKEDPRPRKEMNLKGLQEAPPGQPDMGAQYKTLACPRHPTPVTARTMKQIPSFKPLLSNPTLSPVREVSGLRATGNAKTVRTVEVAVPGPAMSPLRLSHLHIPFVGNPHRLSSR